MQQVKVKKKKRFKETLKMKEGFLRKKKYINRLVNERK